MRIISFATMVLCLSGFACFGIGQIQTKPNKAAASADDLRAIKSSPGYAEVLVRTTELRAEVESLLVDYTEEYPRIKEIKMELELLNSESDRLLAMKAADASKLTLAVGRLILGKVVNQTKLREMRLVYADEHPNVRRQRKVVEVYEAAIKELLG